MTALSIDLRKPVEDPSKVVPLKDAAALIGVSEDSLLRQTDELVMRGMAFFDRPAAGGKRQWFIARSYHAALCVPGYVDRQTMPDLSGFTLSQKLMAFRRREAVELFRQLKQSTPLHVDAVIERVREKMAEKYSGFGVSRTRLFAWAKVYAEPCDLAKLIDARGRRKGSVGAGEAWEYFRSLYLTDHRTSIKQAWRETRRLAAERGWVWPGYSAVVSQLDKEVCPEDQAFHREPGHYRTAMAPYIPQDAEAWDTGQLWIGDHKQLDVICRFGDAKIRPWLTAWMDWRTRRIVGWTLSDSPNSSTILGALRGGIMDETNNGGPEHVWIDNGRDYDSWMFHGQTKRQRRVKLKPRVDQEAAHGIFAMLQIQAHFARAYNPNGKARLERFFRMLEPLAKTFATYTGTKIDLKPERLNEILSDPASIPTFAHVRERLGNFITGYNASDEHSKEDLAEAGKPISPDTAFASWCTRRRVFADPEALDLLMQHWTKPVKVGRNGIAIKLDGRTVEYGRGSDALRAFRGRKKSEGTEVRIAFEMDHLQSVRVYTLDFKYVTTVPLNGVGGGPKINRHHLKTMSREIRQYEASRRKTNVNAIVGVLTTEEHLAVIASRERDQAAAASVTPPHSLRLVQTPLDGQAAAVERVERRPAAGRLDNTRPLRRPFDFLPRDGDAADDGPPLNVLDELVRRAQ